jgi:hypothetical protein
LFPDILHPLERVTNWEQIMGDKGARKSLERNAWNKVVDCVFGLSVTITDGGGRGSDGEY